ncbi:hypothetical protein F01_440210 [Burkholderia cenocepacia]|nr:hypothetical protein F01_440210 [Burkholderia cenocepacia]
MGARTSREKPRSRLQEHVRRHRDDPHALRRERHAVRIRVLRHLAPVQPRALRRSRARETAVLRAERVRPARRDRRASGGPDAHAPDGRPPVRQRLRMVDPRRRAQPDSARDDRRRARRERARRARGFAVDRARQARGIERRASPENASGARRPVARDRDAGRGARDARAQGRRRGEFLIAGSPPQHQNPQAQ